LRLVIASLLIFGLIIVGCASTNAVSTGSLYSLGYTWQPNAASGLFITGPIDFQGQYSHSVPSNYTIARILFDVPWPGDGEILYFNLHLTDGSTHKGSYQNLGEDNYTLTIDGTSYNGKYTYSLLDQLGQLLHLFSWNQMEIFYVVETNDSTQFAIFIECSNGPLSNTDSGLLLPLSSFSIGINSISASSNNNARIYYTETTIEKNINDTISQPAPPSPEDSNPFGLDRFVRLIQSFIEPLIMIGTAVVQLVMLIFLIGRFLIDPYNIILILILFEEFAAIVALSARGDIFISMGKFSKYNIAFFTFMIFMAKGMVQVISYTIQALAVAVQAAAQLAQAGIDTVKGVASWLLTLLIFLK